MPLSFQQNMKFRNNPEEVIDEFKLIGGLITDKHETKLENNQSPDLGDVVFTDKETVKTRNGYTRSNGNPVGIASDTSNTGASTGTLSITANNDYVAQTFIPSTSISVTQIDAYLAMQTTGQTQYVRVELWSTATGEPDSLLDSSQIKQISGTGETTYSFRFRVPVNLTTATTYAIVVKPVVSASASINQVNVHHTANDYANGDAYTTTDGGVSWTSDTLKDLKFNLYSGGNTPNTGLVRYYNTTGTKQMFSKFGTSIYRSDDLTGALTLITMPTGLTWESTGFLDYTVANDTLLAIDGTNYIKKYRGSTNANYSTGTITTTNGSTAIIGSGTSWNTSTNVEVGEYIKLPDTKWYKITNIGSDTSLSIETSYLGAGASGQSYVISPWGEVQGQLATATIPSGLTRPTPQFIENHSNRIWTLDGNSLRYSVLDTSVTEEHFNDWDTVNNAGEIIIPSGQGDTGTGLYSLNNTLYVFQKRAIWGVYGTSPANFELRNITNEVGLINKSTLVEWDNYLIFLSDGGIYLFDGSNLKNVSEGKINTLLNSMADKTKPKAIIWDNKYLLSYPTTSSNYNNEAIFYDMYSGVFGRFKNLYANDWLVWKGGDDSGEIYFGSSNQGSIYRWDSGTNDDGYEIESYYFTPSFSFNANMRDKAMKKFYVQQLALGNWTVDVTQYGNITENITSGTPIDISPGDAAYWDVAQWDVDSWSGEGAVSTERVAEFQGLYKYVKYRIAQEGFNEGMELLGLTTTSRVRRLL